MNIHALIHKTGRRKYDPIIGKYINHRTGELWVLTLTTEGVAKLQCLTPTTRCELYPQGSGWLQPLAPPHVLSSSVNSS